eukprot:9050923-Pyramimonas_sp.AAC.1
MASKCWPQLKFPFVCSLHIPPCVHLCQVVAPCPVSFAGQCTVDRAAACSHEFPTRLSSFRSVVYVCQPQYAGVRL